jgi:site-specific DNA-cytosine methylase
MCRRWVLVRRLRPATDVASVRLAEYRLDLWTSSEPSGSRRTPSTSRYIRHASRVLDRHWPGVPNLGDLFAVDWDTVERIDLLAAGFPCPDYSLAGKRAGIEGDHGQVWFGVLRAVRALRPSLCVFENVTGIRTARGLREDAGESAVGVVVADLAALGYRWAYDCMRAADVGAPHGRDRWFCVAALPSAADALCG